MDLEIKFVKVSERLNWYDR